MNAEKYGAFERYNVELAKQLNSKGYKAVFIFNKIIDVDDYINDLKQNSAEVLLLNANQNPLKLFGEIFKLIKSYKPDSVHTHFNPKIVRLVCYASFLLRVPKRYNTFHGMAQTQKMITKVWMKTLDVLCSHQFAISDAIRNEQLLVFNARKTKVTTLRLGLDKDRFIIALDKQSIRAKYNLPKNAVLIGSVAFHNPIKGVDILLEAFASVISESSKKNYLCQIGSYDQSYTPYLKQKAKDLGISDAIIWLGVQNNVPELLQAFDIYVQPSRSEGLGLAILEAYLAKLPVIATNVGGIPEIVDEDKGLLFNIEDVKGLAKQIQRLVNSETLRHQKAEKGNSYILANYELKTQVNRLLHYY